MADTDSRLNEMFPELVDPKSQSVVIPSTPGYVPPKGDSPTQSSDSSGASVAAAATGAALGYGSSKLLPIQTPDVRARAALEGSQAKAQSYREELARETASTEAARRPYLATRAAAETATDAAKMEVARNEMLMKHVIQRALDAGVDPRPFLKSPETFDRAMSPEAGYGTKNWVKSEYGNVNPIIENRITQKGQAKPAITEFESTGPYAEQVAGRTIQQPSGVYTPAGRGPETGRAVNLATNVEGSMLDAQRAHEAQVAAQSNLPPMPGESRTVSRLQGQTATAEANVASNAAKLAALEAAQPGILQILAKMVSGPKVTAGLAALGGLDLAKIPGELQQGNYAQAAVHGMGGLGGVALMSPIPAAKVIGAGMVAAPSLFEYAPKAYDLAKREMENWRGRQ